MQVTRPSCCAIFRGTTSVKSYIPVLRYIAAVLLLNSAVVQAADGHHDAPDAGNHPPEQHAPENHAPAKHAADKHAPDKHKVDAHKPPGKPMALTPAHKDPHHKEKAPTAEKASPPKTMPLRKPAAAGPAKEVVTAPHSPRKDHAPHWGYQGDGGPEHWGDLKATFKACSAGRRQSPINLEATEPAHLMPLSIHYKVSLIDLVNNGHTVQANYGAGSYITLGNERYDLLQFHFHTPSEHRVADRSFPMEIHFVHRNKRGQLAVIGILVAPGDYNLAAREIWDRLPTQAHTKSANTRALINARDLLPEDTRHFRYSGSLTTPPCSENVNWLVLQTPVRFSEGQIAKLHRIIGMNARPAQARNSRYLLQSIGGTGS